ncbi:acyltransferase family protein [Dactylosporangium sp. CA-052675]|uniref:acyltransferase family protein n=1 Tax=Dactylosporangium sp. CA-052675 TaxID=3239927 RepID=UPI003D9077DF
MAVEQAHNADPAADPAVEPAAEAVVERVRPAHGRLYALDLLRFLAALAVVGFHVLVDFGSRGHWGRPSEQVFGHTVHHVFEYGWLGVECFFVISGFVICMSAWGRGVSDFAVSRVTRLMPVYVFAVLLTSVALMAFPLRDGRPRISDVLVNTTMLQQFFGIRDIDFPYWTLAVELRFYLLFAVLVYFGLTYRRVVLFCALWMAAALYGQYTGFPPVAKTVSAEYAPYFVAGILLYLIHRFGANLLLLGGLAVTIVASVPGLIKRVAFFHDARYAVTFNEAFLVMVAFFAVMLAIALGWSSWLRWRGLAVVGALTYPLYLLHMQLGRIVVERLHTRVSPWLLAGGLALACIVFALLVNRLYERPAARFVRSRLRESFAQIRAADR